MAVATGSFTRDALAGADVVARNAAELRSILAELGIGSSGSGVSHR